MSTIDKIFQFTRDTNEFTRDTREIKTPDQNAQAQITETFKLLDQSKDIELLDQHRDLTLIVGPTGSGKSTFAQWFVGDNSKLIARKKTGGTILIEDEFNKRISNSTIVSKTSIPELIIDANTNAAFYDCPGFSDTRSSSKDIAGTYFMKKLLDHARSVKIIFVVKHLTVKPGFVRDHFAKSLEHVTELIKNIDKYEDSISIVATQVETFNVKDDEIIDGITEFLKVHVQKILECSLLKRSSIGSCSEEDMQIYANKKKFCENGIKLLNILLHKQGDKFDRIGIFKSPLIEGRLNENKALQENKRIIEDMVYNKLKFTAKKDSDFGYTISDSSKNFIHNLVESINQRVWSESGFVSARIEIYYHELFANINSKVDSLNLKQTVIGPDDISKGLALSNAIANGYIVMTNLIENLKNIGADKVAAQLNSAVGRLNLGDCQIQTENIDKQGKYFQFLQSLTDQSLSIELWETIFQPIVTYLSEAREKLQANIDNSSSKIMSKIEAEIGHMAELIESCFEKKNEHMDIEKFISRLVDANKVIGNILNSTQSLVTAQELSLVLRDNIASLDVDLRSVVSTENDIHNLGQSLSFLKILSTRQLRTYSSNWISRLIALKSNLEESKRLYVFLDELYQKLSTYDSQKNRDKYNVANIEDWGNENKNKRIHIDKDNAVKFLEKIDEFKLPSGTPRNITFSESRLTSLNAVLSSTIDDRLDIACESNDLLGSSEKSLVIRGNYIKFSDFIFEPSGSIAFRPFKDCNGDPTSINVFASDTLFIDKDLNGKGKRFKLSLMAPKWNVVGGTRSIILNGEDAGDHDPSFASGRDPGKPGNPGGPAGSLFGFGDQFINQEKLHIFVEGGKGGKGQDGANGSNGNDGESPSNDPKYWSDRLKCPREQIPFQKFGFESRVTYFDNGNSSVIFYGKPGEKGEIGTDGGRGGKPGRSGHIIIISSQEETPFVRHGGWGIHGEAGAGGKGGLNGKKGDGVIMSCYNDWKFQHSWERSFGRHGQDDGLSGMNDVEMKQPTQSITINQIDVINKYKVFLRDNLNLKFNFARKYLLSNIYSRLESDSHIVNLYDFRVFANELLSLENQSHKLNRDNLIMYYQSLQDRLDEYSKDLKPHDQTDEAKTALNYLHMATLSKLRYLDTNSESDLIIDLESYLDLVKKNLDLVSTLQDKTSKQNQIKSRNDIYKQSINDKIKEANDFIEKVMKPAIDQSYKRIDEKISLLIREIENLRKSEEGRRDELYKKERELARLTESRIIFSIFKGIGQILSFFGPIGAAVGNTVSSVASTIEGITIDSKLNNIMNRASSDIKISQIPNLLEKLSADREPKKMPIENAETKQNSNQRKYELGAKAFDAVQQSAITGVEIYNQYKGDEKELNTIRKEIQDSGGNIEKLKKSEESIRESMQPMIDKTKNMVNIILASMDKKSQVDLEVKKWQIQDMLKQMKSTISQSTKGFDIQDDLAFSIEQVQDAMTTLINIYDQIQHYQDEKKLGDYIADISAPCDGADQYCTIQNELNRMIKSNYLMLQCKIASHNLRQWVFPLARKYVKEFDIPAHRRLNDTDLVDLVSDAKNKIDLMNDNVKKYRTSILKSDRYLFNTVFNGDYTSSKPFYIWKNNEHKELIHKLLSGEEIVLHSDITKSQPDKDAIKFNLIEFNFKATPQVKQSEFNNILKNFKINAVHLGNSRYRYNGKYYVITSESQNIEYSFEKRTDGFPVTCNKVYQKIKGGDIMLSPYTMWRLQLIKLTDRATHDELKIYKDEIDLELVGQGSYVSRELDSKDLKVEDYYEPDNSLNIHRSTENIANIESKEKQEHIDDSLSNSTSNTRHKRSLGSTHQSEFRNNSVKFINSQSPLEYMGEDSSMSLSAEIANRSSTRSPSINGTPNLIPEGSSKLVNGNNEWLNNANFNGFLLWANLLARKISGHEEKSITNRKLFKKAELIPNRSKSMALVDIFLKNMKKNLEASGISGSRFLPDEEGLERVEKMVYRRLMRGETKTISDLLFKEFVEKGIDRIEGRSTKKQAKIFLKRFEEASTTIKNELMNTISDKR